MQGSTVFWNYSLEQNKMDKQTPSLPPPLQKKNKDEGMRKAKRAISTFLIWGSGV